MIINEGIILHVAITYSKSMDQPGKVANPARGQLSTGKNGYFPVPVAPENLVSRDGFDRPVPRQPAYSPHTQLNLVLTHGILLPNEWRYGPLVQFVQQRCAGTRMIRTEHRDVDHRLSLVRERGESEILVASRGVAR